MRVNVFYHLTVIINSIESQIRNEKTSYKSGALYQLFYLLLDEMCVNQMNDIEINVKVFFDSST